MPSREKKPRTSLVASPADVGERVDGDVTRQAENDEDG
jgi:hypothetical protein